DKYGCWRRIFRSGSIDGGARAVGHAVRGGDRRLPYATGSRAVRPIADGTGGYFGNTEAIQFRNAGSPAVCPTCLDLFAEPVARLLRDAHGDHRPDSVRTSNALSPF